MTLQISSNCFLDAPESTATVLHSTSTAVTSTALPASTVSGVEAGTSSPTQFSSPSSSKSTGPIVGGAVGGAVALGAIVAFVTWLCIRRRQTRQTKAPSTMYDGAAPTNSMYTTPNPFTPPATRPKIYVSSCPMV